MNKQEQGTSLKILQHPQKERSTSKAIYQDLHLALSDILRRDGFQTMSSSLLPRKSTPRLCNNCIPQADPQYHVFVIPPFQLEHY